MNPIDVCTAALAVAFQRHVDVATMQVYRDTLSDLPHWAIEAAALQLRRTGGAFFPPAAVWHQVAEELMATRNRDALLLGTGDRRSYECEACRDTGWCEVDREGRLVCIPCSCRPTNGHYRQLTLSSRKTSQ